MLLPLLATLALFDSPGMPIPVDGYSIHSSDRSLELFVMPDDRYGKAGAQYTLTGPSGERYDVHHDFRLREAHVFDTGQVAGFVERRWDVGDVRERGEYLVVVALDADGAVVGEEWSQPARVDASSRYPTPSAQRLLPLAGAGTFIVETWVAEANGAVWTCYALDGGGATGSFRVPMGSLTTFAGQRAWVRRPCEPLVGPPGAAVDGWRTEPDAWDEKHAWRRGSPHDVVVVPGVGLLLESWALDGAFGEPRTQVMNLIDGKGRVVARRVLEGALFARDGSDYERDPATWALEVAAISNWFDLLRVDATRPRFAELQFKSNFTSTTEVAWEVREVDGAWRVERLEGDARELVVPAPPVPEAPRLPERPVEVVEHELERLDSSTLPLEVEGAEWDEWGWTAPALFDGALAWQMDGDGVLAILRVDDEERLVCARFDAELRALGDVVLQDDGLWEQLGVEPTHWRKRREAPYAEALGNGRFMVLGGGVRIALLALVPGSAPDALGLRVDFVGDLRDLSGLATLDLAESLVVTSAHGLPGGGVLVDLEGRFHDDTRWLVALGPVNLRGAESGLARIEVTWADNSEERVDGPDFEWDHVTTMADGRVVALDGSERLLQWSPIGERMEPVAIARESPRSGEPMDFDWLTRWSEGEVLFLGSVEPVLVDVETGVGRALHMDSVALVDFDAERGTWYAADPGGQVWARGENAVFRLANDGKAPAGEVVEARLVRGEGLRLVDDALILDDGRVVLVDGAQARFVIWEPETGPMRFVDVAPGDATGLMAGLELHAMPDGRVRMSTPWQYRSYVELFLDPVSGELARSVRFHESALTPDGRYRWEWRYPGILEVSTADGTHVRTIEQHGRGLWFNSVYNLWFAEDGSVWVKEGSTTEPHDQHHARFSPDGVELEVVRATDTHPDGNGTTFDGPLALSGDAIYEDPNGPAPRRHTFIDLPSGAMAAPRSAPGELWHFELETLTLHRYRMPDELLRD